MSDEILIRAEGVSKKFCRSLKRSLWYGVQDIAAELNPFSGRTDNESKITNHSHALRAGEFWAVNDVSFELRRGECLGLIGRNGAGKTTLLKMLNGLIKPDRGRIEMHGRIGALIALGAGFNPILTGRENIYVNGSVLGLTKNEIGAKLDDIIDFADIDDFIDTPVQSYSSGMQVRLGFAVATAVDPDVLLLDEVLAVGDAPFRAKCYERLSRLRKSAAVIFVSHNLEQVAQVTTSALFLTQGTVTFLGQTERAVSLYQKFTDSDAPAELLPSRLSTSIAGTSVAIPEVICSGDTLLINLSFTSLRPISCLDVKIQIKNTSGSVAAEYYSRSRTSDLKAEVGPSILELTLGPLHLAASRYCVAIALLDRETNEHLYWSDRAAQFEVSGPVSHASAYVPDCLVVLNSISAERIEFS